MPWSNSRQLGSDADCRRYWPPTWPAIRDSWGSTRSAPPASCANTALSDALVAKHGGRIVKTTRDGVLIEFPSVIDAVECAVAVQAVMAERNESMPVDRRMLFRIGINLGDILIEGDDILGDGVNVAARLEGIAEPGGICISYSAYDQVRGKVAVAFTDLGAQGLKNIDRPVRVYAAKSRVIFRRDRCAERVARECRGPKDFDEFGIGRSRSPTSRPSQCCHSRT